MALERQGPEEKWIIQNLSFWLQKEADEDFIALVSKKMDFLRESLDLRYPCRGRVWAMRCIQSVLKRCGSKARFIITDMIKTLQRAGLKHTREKGGLFFDEIQEIKQKTKAPGFDWKGHRAVFCITHDIDYSEGYTFSPDLIRMDRDFDIRPTVNILTEGDYEVSGEWLKEISGLGAEIGLHGATHDIAFGYRKPESIRREVLRATDYLPFKPFGFRAPALSLSLELLKVLDEAGFIYDSSFRAFDREKTASGACFPFRFSPMCIWEFPVTLQDTDLFRDKRMSGSEALDLFRKTIERIIEIGGMGVFNFHPCVIKSRLEFYREFLKCLNAYRQDRIWISPMREVAAFLNSR